jgi:hypothetical protein
VLTYTPQLGKRPAPLALPSSPCLTTRTDAGTHFTLTVFGVNDVRLRFLTAISHSLRLKLPVSFFVLRGCTLISNNPDKKTNQNFFASVSVCLSCSNLALAGTLPLICSGRTQGPAVPSTPQLFCRPLNLPTRASDSPPVAHLTATLHYGSTEQLLARSRIRFVSRLRGVFGRACWQKVASEAQQRTVATAIPTARRRPQLVLLGGIG